VRLLQFEACASSQSRSRPFAPRIGLNRQRTSVSPPALLNAGSSFFESTLREAQSNASSFLLGISPAAGAARTGSSKSEGWRCPQARPSVLGSGYGGSGAALWHPYSKSGLRGAAPLDCASAVGYSLARNAQPSFTALPPNPSIEGTSNGGAHWFAPSRSATPLAAPHVKR